MHTDQYLHYSSHHEISCKESVVSSMFNRVYSTITHKDDLTKESTRIKQLLRGTDIRNTLLLKPLRELLTIAACSSHSNKY